MKKSEAEQLCIKLNHEVDVWKSNRAQRTPNYTEWRQGVPEECMTEHFLAFAEQTSKSGMELKNSFSIYSKLAIIAPDFVNKYIQEGARIERPITGEWNLREKVEEHYGISESVYRIIEQEKVPDSRGTARSGLEALQAMFIKGCKLSETYESGDYIVDGITYENKGEAGRLIGQNRIFSSEGYKGALERLASRYRTNTFDKALRKAWHAGTARAEVKNILKNIYPAVDPDVVEDCADVYEELINTIPETYIIEEYRKYCKKRETLYTDAIYEVKKVAKVKQTPTADREKEILRFVCGLMELKYYQQEAKFDVLDICENKTGRIFSFDCRNMNIKDMAARMWGRVRMYASIGTGTRDGAHQIGFYY